jgi:iron-regulated transporter 1
MQTLSRTERDIVVSRLLTRTGDQAWDFAIPLVLTALLPDGIQAAAAYYLVIRLAQVLIVPRIGALIDRWPRVSVLKLSIGLQTGFMLASLGLVLLMAAAGSREFSRATEVLWLLPLTIAGLLASLGATLTEIAVANDIVPTVVPPERLARVNSRIKQVDLVTEVGAPILAGALMMWQPQLLPLLGFITIAVWNVLSFVPEFVLLRRVIRGHPALADKRVAVEALPAPLGERLFSGWRVFFSHAAMPAMLAYALLWLSVLSPHGLLLAAFLNKGWGLSELTIGMFRGAGALFGMASTYLYPVAEKSLGAVKAARTFVLFQAAMILMSVPLFALGPSSPWGFFAVILLSRIGLYGFSIGETQIRQQMIAADERGRINGFASALTSVATLGLYGLGVAFATPETFVYLVATSAAAVTTAAAVYWRWSCRPR